MKFLLILAAAVCVANAQRPFYAGRSRYYPQVLPQYLEEREKVGVPNRVDDSVSTSSPSSTTSTTTSSPDLSINDNSIGDTEDEYIKMIQTWPRDKQPFWYLNAKQIEEHLGSGNGGRAVPNHRPFYAG